MGQKNEAISKQENKNNNLILNADIDSENEEYILEGKCGDSVEIEKNIEKKLFEKAQNATCKIISEVIGTGFFFEIPYRYIFERKKRIKALLTNNHVLNEESLKIGKKIKILYKGQSKEIKITNDGLCFTDSRDYKKGLDYTFIQIFDDDGILDFFQIFNDNINFEHEIVSLVGYYNGVDFSIKNGHLKDIKNYKIYHSIDTDHGCSGAPIILTYREFEVIGIHRCFIDKKKLNLGSNFQDILKDLYHKDLAKKLNEIQIWPVGIYEISGFNYDQYFELDFFDFDEKW